MSKNREPQFNEQRAVSTGLGALARYGPSSRICPKCEAPVGHRCRKTLGSGMVTAMKTYHKERRG